MKFVVTFDPKTFKTTSFQYDEPGPLPPIVTPPDPDAEQDTAPPKPEEKPKPS